MNGSRTKEVKSALQKKNLLPTSPVDGLETVAYQYKIPRNGHWDNLPSDWTADECKAYNKQETRELVNRSQAEAIIAAKDAQLHEAQLARDEAGFTGTITECIKFLDADNEALTARVKELGNVNNNQDEMLQFLREDHKALETQLAAARKALEDIAVNTSLDAQHYFARAALEAKP